MDQAQQSTDDGIRERLAAGDYRTAFERTVELYSTRVFHLAFSMMRNETQAEDMTQDILLRIWKGLPGYHGEASVSTWIYTIARNTCLTELKKRAARPTVSLHEPEFEEGIDRLTALQTNDPEAGAGMDVNLLLDQLPDKYRQVITLFYLEQNSYEEVGAMLGLPLGTVKTFIYRARQQLLKLSRQRAVPALAHST